MADVDAANFAGVHAHHVAAQSGHTAALQVLLDHGAKVDAANRSGVQAHYVAAQDGHTAALLLLLNRGAEVDAATSDGRQALHFAALQLLIDRGAGLKDGGRAVAAAVHEGHMQAAAGIGVDMLFTP